MQRAPAEQISLPRRLVVVGGTVIAMASLAAVPAHAQAQNDTAASTKKDSAAAKPAAAGGGSAQFIIGGNGSGKGGSFQITGGQGMVLQMVMPATPGQKSDEPKIRTDADSAKADSTKAAAADSSAAAGKKP